MIAQILNQMPSAYENKVDHIKHLIDIGNKPTLVKVIGHLREKFMSLNKDDVLNSRMSNNTKALIIKQFKGYCRECGEYGHKKTNCPKLRKNKKNQKKQQENPKEELCQEFDVLLLWQERSH